MQRIGLVTVVVPDYDSAIDFYVRVVGFELVSDIPSPQPGQPGKRWVVVAPREPREPRETRDPQEPSGSMVASRGAGLLLARAVNATQAARIGDQTGGRVALFLSTDDFHADHRRMVAAGVTFLERPRREPYGWVAVWQDPFGNRWDLLEDGAGSAVADSAGSAVADGAGSAGSEVAGSAGSAGSAVDDRAAPVDTTTDGPVDTPADGPADTPANRI